MQIITKEPSIPRPKSYTKDILLNIQKMLEIFIKLQYLDRKLHILNIFDKTFQMYKYNPRYTKTNVCSIFETKDKTKSFLLLPSLNESKITK